MKDSFNGGSNEPICSQIPWGKIHWSMVKYIDHALLLSGSSFKVGIAEELHSSMEFHSSMPHHGHAAELLHVMAATPEPLHFMAATPEPLHVMAATPEPLHIMAATPEPLYVMAATLESPNLMVVQVSHRDFLKGAIVTKLQRMRSLAHDESLQSLDLSQGG